MERWTTKPMLANPGTADMRFDDSWAAEGKLDGHRAMFYRDADGVVHQFNGRNAADYTGRCPYLEEAVSELLPPDSCIDGELLSPLRGPAGREHVQSVMFTQQTHVPSELSPALYVVAFDMLRLDGRDLRSEPWSYRREDLEGLPEVPGVQLSLVLPNDVALQVALAAGLEGVVFKRRRSTYQGRRSADWVKVKPQQSVEARVVGFKDGKAGGAWSGKVGAFEIELVDSDLQLTGVRTTVKCGRDDYHLQATAERAGEPIAPLWLGALIEVAHHGINPKSGVPLHPQNKGRRGDLEDQKFPHLETSQPQRRPPVASTKRRMRNYKQMRPENLLRAAYELRAGLVDGNTHFEAYARCVESGSGDPERDLAECDRLIAEHNLKAA